MIQKDPASEPAAAGEAGGAAAAGAPAAVSGATNDTPAGGASPRTATPPETIPETAAPRVVRVRVFVDGRVQGVGYRAGAAREAMRLGVTGYARNLPDGRVEAVYEGPQPAVDDMLTWTRRGPVSARVDSMDIHDEQPKGERGFSTR